MSQVLSKGGVVDALIMPRELVNKMRALLRAAGGASIEEYRDLPDGTGRVLTYNGAVILRNDDIRTNITRGTGTTTSFYAVCWDGGIRSDGLALITSPQNGGITVQPGGMKDATDVRYNRIGWNNALVNFNGQAIRRRQHVTLT